MSAEELMDELMDAKKKLIKKYVDKTFDWMLDPKNYVKNYRIEIEDEIDAIPKASIYYEAFIVEGSVECGS